MLEPIDLLKKLDDSLDELTSVIVCGGLVIHLRYGGVRSLDIDSMTYLQQRLGVAIRSIAEKTGEDENWFNDDAVKFYNFDQTLPEGWEDRSWQEEPIFAGKFLKLYPLAKRDLILTKLFGVFSRGGWLFLKDLHAIKKNIGASEDDIIKCVDDLYRMLKGTRWEATKEKIVDFLKKSYHI